MERQPLMRLGLSSAALKAAVLAELEEGGMETDADIIASAVADAVDANNQELFRQLRSLLRPEPEEVASMVGPEPEQNS